MFSTGSVEKVYKFSVYLLLRRSAAVAKKGFFQAADFLSA
jgi:hypothetical protein